MVDLIEATESDVDIVVKLLIDMSEELDEFDGLDESVLRQSISQAMLDSVHYFLFFYNGEIIGTCHVQEVHSYWRLKKRFYLGGFYIKRDFRGNGSFKKVYQKLKLWVERNGGIQIYSHIHESNTKSLRSFESVGHEDEGYVLSINHWAD